MTHRWYGPSGSCGCCPGGCGCKCTCSACKDGLAPCCWKVYFTLLPVGYESYAGIYYMNQDAPGGCSWSRNYPPACGPETSFVITDNGNDTYTVTITLDPPALAPLVFQETYDGNPDCCLLTPMSPPLVSGQESPPGGTTATFAYCTDFTSCPLLPCRWCDEATLPRFIQVTIPGPMYNRCGGCVGCENLPGTYILELVDGCPTDGCKWVADISGVVDCGLYKHTIEFWYNTASGYWYMEILLDASSPMSGGPPENPLTAFSITGWDCSTITTSGKGGPALFPTPPACTPHPLWCQGYVGIAFEANPNV